MSYKAVAALAFTSMFSISTLLSPAYAQEQEKALNFGIISTESQQNLKPQWEPFLKDMETKLGIKVNAFFAPDYAGIIQGMRFNKVDIAWYGNLSAMEAVDSRERPGLCPDRCRGWLSGLLERADRQ
jgi:phosphonate transport system substrate-binding protein